MMTIRYLRYGDTSENGHGTLEADTAVVTVPGGVEIEATAGRDLRDPGTPAPRVVVRLGGLTVRVSDGG